MTEPQSKTETSGSKNAYSRRDFLKSFPILIGGSYVGVKTLEGAFYKSVSAGLEDPRISDDLVGSVLKIAETAPNSENTNFHSMEHLIGEGIGNYTKSSSKPVFYQRDSEYKESGFYGAILKKVSSPSLMIRNPKEVLKLFELSLPPKLLGVFFSSSPRIQHFEHIFLRGSGFREKLRKGHPECFGENGELIDYSSEVVDIYRSEGRKYISKMVDLVEEGKLKKGSSVSGSYLLELFLTENAGDLAKSIYDVGIFLKFMARNNQETGRDEFGEKQISWFLDNIEDEYMGPSYMDESDSSFAINLIGKPYHSWNLVALLQFFPVEMVRVGGIYKQLSTFKDQGLGKTRSDLQTLKDLREIEKLLASYSK